MLRVAEMFNSIQGEGARQGTYSTFVRLAGCNLSCSFCDTKITRYEEMTEEEVLSRVEAAHLPLIWTGGEPCLQLTKETVQMFRDHGVYQSIETNGTLPIPPGLDYIAVSPKGPIHPSIEKVHELRFPGIPGDYSPLQGKDYPYADHHFISPLFDKNGQIFKASLYWCLHLIEQQPWLRLSVQVHKLIEVR